MAVPGSGSAWCPSRRVEQCDLGGDRPPSAVAVAPLDGLPCDPAVFAPRPPYDPVPGIAGQVSEGGGGHAGPEVRAPASQRRVELADEGLERLVDAAPADRLHFHRHGLDGFAGRVGVDVVPAGASLAVALDAPAEEVEALIDVGDLRLLRRQAQAHRGQDRRRVLAHLLRVLAGAGDHEQPVVRIADEPVVAQALGAAGGRWLWVLPGPPGIWAMCSSSSDRARLASTGTECHLAAPRYYCRAASRPGRGSRP